MDLLVQPQDGLRPMVDALQGAQHSIDILIFRLDCRALERALLGAALRGVAVRALLAHTSLDAALTRFAQHLQDAGAEVVSSAADLLRYHAKMLVVDGRLLYLLAFNLTRRDLLHSRSFAAITEEPALVQEASRLFANDWARVPYRAQADRLVVSPSNARTQLRGFVKGTRRQLLIYAMRVSDPEFLRLLQKRVASGVEVRILAHTMPKKGRLPVRASPLRLHARAMVRDGELAFVGSMSLRRLELDARREAGLVFDDPRAVKRLKAVFEADWAAAQPVRTGLATPVHELP